MSFSGKRLILSVFTAGLVASVGFATVSVVRDHSLVCMYDDPVVCSFLSDVRKGRLSKLQGTYMEQHKGEEVYTVTWKRADKDQDILYKDDIEEQLHIVFVDDWVYLKDYSDGRWWEQSRDMMEQYETQLPFEPAVFISNLESYFVNDRNRIYFIQDDICGLDACRKYALTIKDAADKKILFYLSEKHGLLQKVQIDTGDLAQEITFNYEDPQIAKPDRNVKQAQKGENIFLENFIERSTTVKNTPDYIREFEQHRIESEGTDTQSGPQYLDYEDVTPSL